MTNLKHCESLNSYVFTTKSIVYKKEPILWIIYDYDGDWQFLNGENNLTEKDAMVISFGEILQLDSTLMEAVSRLNLGEIAFRKDSYSPWIIAKYD